MSSPPDRRPSIRSAMLFLPPLALAVLSLLGGAGCEAGGGPGGQDACQQYCQAQADCIEDEAESEAEFEDCDADYQPLRDASSTNPASSAAWQEALANCEEDLAEYECP